MSLSRKKGFPSVRFSTADYLTTLSLFTPSFLGKGYKQQKECNSLVHMLLFSCRTEFIIYNGEIM
jgi:hypothetical protein